MGKRHYFSAEGVDLTDNQAIDAWAQAIWQVMYDTLSEEDKRELGIGDTD